LIIHQADRVSRPKKVAPKIGKVGIHYFKKADNINAKNFIFTSVMLSPEVTLCSQPTRNLLVKFRERRNPLSTKGEKNEKK